ncbi:hypothetical protein JL09_g6138 [Pichia kudriavzevii]|uniref:Integrase zinc-binding domain-containing protein n=1 Tax=Pichia kudriavzevii TaxID=4909 RepID=A0A099NPH3_PICKU|nr:hypothetical protein JL09_g6138 [Pichia kudriavzevii]
MKLSYEEDNEIKEIYDILKENLSIPKSIHNYTKHYSIEDNLLYFSVVKGENDRRIVVSPKSKLVQEIIGNAHDGNSAGHFGYFKTYMRLHPMFYWSNMLKSEDGQTSVWISSQVSPDAKMDTI